MRNVCRLTFSRRAAEAARRARLELLEDVRAAGTEWARRVLFQEYQREERELFIRHQDYVRRAGQYFVQAQKLTNEGEPSAGNNAKADSQRCQRSAQDLETHCEAEIHTYLNKMAARTDDDFDDAHNDIVRHGQKGEQHLLILPTDDGRLYKSRLPRSHSKILTNSKRRSSSALKISRSS